MARNLSRLVTFGGAAHGRGPEIRHSDQLLSAALCLQEDRQDGPWSLAVLGIHEAVHHHNAQGSTPSLTHARRAWGPMTNLNAIVGPGGCKPQPEAKSTANIKQQGGGGRPHTEVESAKGSHRLPPCVRGRMH